MTVDSHASTVGIRALICPLCMFVGKIDTRFKSLLWNGVHLKKHGLETIVTCYRHITLFLRGHIFEYTNSYTIHICDLLISFTCMTSESYVMVLST